MIFINSDNAESLLPLSTPSAYWNSTHWKSSSHKTLTMSMWSPPWCHHQAACHFRNISQSITLLTQSSVSQGDLNSDHEVSTPHVTTKWPNISRLFPKYKSTTSLDLNSNWSLFSQSHQVFWHSKTIWVVLYHIGELCVPADLKSEHAVSIP